MTDKITLVAHRGEPASFPENSLQGFSHALQSGAAYIETDVNVSADGVVVLSHDENLKKLTGQDISITQNAYEVFRDIPAGYTERFSDRYKHCRIATLAQLAALLQSWPETTCFVELKQESLRCFGNEMIDLVVDSLQTIRSQAVLISFDYDALCYARENHPIPVGWVLPEWTAENRMKAENLSPHYLFIDKALCPPHKNELWRGAWRWVVYTANSLETIYKYSDMGIRFIETDCFSELLDAVESNTRKNQQEQATDG